LGAGFVVGRAARHLSRGYIMIAGIAFALVVSVLAVALLLGATPALPSGRAPDWPGTSGRASIHGRWPRPASGSRRSPGPR
jgi:hypothetical protein